MRGGRPKVVVADASHGEETVNFLARWQLARRPIEKIWSDVLARHIAYPGDDTVGFERKMRQFMPSWMAFDMRLMAERFLRDGMLPETGDAERLTTLLGRPLRTYRDFAAEASV